MINKTKICGFDISTGSLKHHLDLVHARIADKSGAWIVTLNTEMLSRISGDQEYRDLLLQADVMVADGMPIVWTANRKNPSDKIEGRTTGVDLVEGLLSENNIAPYAIIGGVDPLTTIQQYPRAEDSCKFLFTGIVDLSEEQTSSFVTELKENEVQIVYLALGVPKQDKLALQLRAQLPHLILMGIGGTFEILSPSGGRAPEWMQNSGLEWFYRLTREPGRLWKRYIVNYPTGIKMLVKDYFKG